MAASTFYVLTPLYLPAATWYEKHDLSSTDMHPYVHPFNQLLMIHYGNRVQTGIFIKRWQKHFQKWQRLFPWNV